MEWMMRWSRHHFGGGDFLGDRFWHNPSPRQLFERDLERHGCSCGHLRCSVLHVRYDVSNARQLWPRWHK